MRDSASAGRAPLVIGCGALAVELVELTRRAGLPAMDLTCLPASLHNRPERIPGAVAARIRRARAEGYDRIFVAYADCGTGGLLDRVLEAEGVARLEGAHCYEVYAGRAAFAAMADAEPGTFYLTDFLVRNFDRLVVRGLGLDRHPELLPLYFGNYRRLVYLAQTDDAELTACAVAAARRLGLAYERRHAGLGELAPSIAAFASAAQMASLITIWWRDIPMQVIARDRRQAHKVVLHPRFQVAVDKAAMKAGKRAASDYVEEMRRDARECGDDLEAESNAEAARLEAAYTKDVLATLVASGGVGTRL